MSLELITPPAIEPVTLDEAKAHLKVDTTDDDALITRLISASRARAEWHTGRAFVTQRWIQWLDRWPICDVVELEPAPVQSVTSVIAYAPDDTATVLDPATYQVDAASSPPRLTWKANVFPPANLRTMNAFAIDFTAGYGDAATDVPTPIVEAILELIAFSYENRGEAQADMPLDALALLSPYRIFTL